MKKLTLTLAIMLLGTAIAVAIPAAGWACSGHSMGSPGSTSMHQGHGSDMGMSQDEAAGPSPQPGEPGAEGEESVDAGHSHHSQAPSVTPPIEVPPASPSSRPGD